MSAHKHHLVPIGHYIGVFLALIVLTGATVWTAKMDLGIYNTPVAMLIAVIKATLVIMIFMHVRWAGKLTKLFVVTGFVWLLILFAFPWADMQTRDWLPF